MHRLTLQVLFLFCASALLQRNETEPTTKESYTISINISVSTNETLQASNKSLKEPILNLTYNENTTSEVETPNLTLNKTESKVGLTLMSEHSDPLVKGSSLKELEKLKTIKTGNKTSITVLDNIKDDELQYSMNIANSIKRMISSNTSNLFKMENITEMSTIKPENTSVVLSEDLKEDLRNALLDLVEHNTSKNAKYLLYDRFKPEIYVIHENGTVTVYNTATGSENVIAPEVYNNTRNKGDKKQNILRPQRIPPLHHSNLITSIAIPILAVVVSAGILVCLCLIRTGKLVCPESCRCGRCCTRLNFLCGGCRSGCCSSVSSWAWRRLSQDFDRNGDDDAVVYRSEDEGVVEIIQ